MSYNSYLFTSQPSIFHFFIISFICTFDSFKLHWILICNCLMIRGKLYYNIFYCKFNAHHFIHSIFSFLFWLITTNQFYHQKSFKMIFFAFLRASKKYSPMAAHFLVVIFHFLQKSSFEILNAYYSY